MEDHTYIPSMDQLINYPHMFYHTAQYMHLSAYEGISPQNQEVKSNHQQSYCLQRYLQELQPIINDTAENYYINPITKSNFYRNESLRGGDNNALNCQNVYYESVHQSINLNNNQSEKLSIHGDNVKKLNSEIKDETGINEINDFIGENYSNCVDTKALQVQILC